MDQKMHDKGLAVRKAVLGEACVNNALKNVAGRDLWRHAGGGRQFSNRARVFR